MQNIPASRLYRVLKTIPNYVYQLRAPRHIQKRSYEIDGYLKYMETDLAFMKPFAVSLLKFVLNKYHWKYQTLKKFDILFLTLNI